jgi:hypothetical protein
MNFLLATVFAIAGIGVLARNKSLSDKLGKFYAGRFGATFGNFAHVLGWDDPNRSFNKFVYRGFVISAGLIFLVFALAAIFGTNFVGPTTSVTTHSILQVN